MIAVPLMAAMIGVAPGGNPLPAVEQGLQSGPHSFDVDATQALTSPNDGAPAVANRSIYRVSPIVDGAVIAAGALGVALPYAFSGSLIKPRCPCDPNEVNSFDRPAIGNSSDAADVVSNVSAAVAIAGAPLLSFLDVAATPAFLEDMTVFAEVLAVNGALVTFAKYAARRPLPRVYALQAPDLINSPSGYRSFYSGHTANTFAALSFAATSWGLRHGDALWPWVVTILLGASVAVERVLSGYHFPTDVIVGAAMGTAVGIAIPRLHARRQSGGGSLAFLPRSDGPGIAWAMRW